MNFCGSYTVMFNHVGVHDAYDNFLMVSDILNMLHDDWSLLMAKGG